GRYLMLYEVVFRLRAANSRPAFPRSIDDVQVVRNLGDEVIDVCVPVSVERRGEEQSRIVVDEHEAHVVERADLACAVEVAAEQLQETAQPCRTARQQRNDDRQLGYFAETGAHSARALDGRGRRLRNLARKL